MTQDELLELSLRARLAQAKSDDIRAMFTPAKTTVVFNDYRIWCNATNAVLINRQAKQFFWHPLGSINGPAGPLWIECSNDHWAQDLLTKLRTDQVLDQLATIE